MDAKAITTKVGENVRARVDAVGLNRQQFATALGIWGNADGIYRGRQSPSQRPNRRGPWQRAIHVVAGAMMRATVTDKSNGELRALKVGPA